VIAKVGKYYRSLAAIHHQWLYGVSAVRTGLRLVSIFESKHNREALRQELAIAAKLFPSDRQQQPKLESKVGRCPLPIITTCLVVGASCDPEEARHHPVHELLFGMEYDAGDNNNGITVIDITELSRVRYCFVDFFGMESERSVPLNTPLTAWDYTLAYYDRADEIVQKYQESIESLQRRPLIGIQDLHSAWPSDSWQLDDTILSDTEPEPTQSSTGTSLYSTALAKLVDEALESVDFDFATLDPARELPNFQRSLRDYLTANPAKVVRSSSASPLLQIALANEKRIDLGMFHGLSVDCIHSLLYSPQLRDSVDVLILPSTAAALPTDALAELLPPKIIKELYLLENADRDGDESAEKFIALLPRVEKLVMSSVFSRGVRMNPILAADASPQASPAFPVLQIIARLPEKFRDGSVIGCMFLGDAMVSPVRFIAGLFKALRTHTEFSSGNGLDVALSLASAPRSLADASEIDISPLPSELYMIGKLSYLSSMYRNCWSRMRDLTSETWTVMLEVDRSLSKDDQRPYLTARFKLAFIKAKRLMRATAETSPSPDDFEILDIDGFMATVAPGSPGLDTLKDSLGRFAGGASSEPALSAMTVDESLGLLEDALKATERQRPYKI
ncbi:hypothetical protein F4778DRAFT_766939, partial [Xylariomycetidae sp. FL2044]